MVTKMNRFNILFMIFSLSLATTIGVLSVTNHSFLIILFGILALVFLFVYFFRYPKKLLFISVVFLPFTSVLTISLAGAKLSIPDALIMLLFVITISRSLISTKRNKKTITITQSRIIKAFIILILFSLCFSIINYYQFKDTFILPPWVTDFKSMLLTGIISNMRLIIPLSILISMFMFIKNKKDFNYIIKLFLYGSFIASLYGFYEFIIKETGLGFSFLLPGHPQTILYAFGGLTRISGTFGEPSYFAGYLVLSIFICLYAKNIKIFSKSAMNLLILFDLILLVLTYSTTGYFSLFVGYLFYLFFSKKTHLFFALIYIPLLFMLIINFVPTVQDVVMKPFDNSTDQLGSSTDRVNTIIAAVNMFIDKPVTGIGYGNYPFLYNEYKDNNAVYKTEGSIANNVYMDLLSSYGILGIILVLFIAFQFKHNMKTIKIHSKNEYKYYAGALISILVLFLAYPTFNFGFHWFFFTLIFIRARLLYM